MKEIKLSDRFKEVRAPQTNRRVIQLMQGNGFCYPLYYFIPSVYRGVAFLFGTAKITSPSQTDA